MPAAGMRLGVDFGTSNTVAVLGWPDGRARPLIFDGSPLLPSAAYAEPAGALIVGRDAVHSARLDPARFEPNPKRRIDDGVVLLGEREIPVTDLVAGVLSRVSEEVRRTAGDAAIETTVTCPASWGATRRLVIADAASAAGLGQVRVVPEPVAAAAYFTQVLGREVPIGSVVVVYDFGAGTFDASVVARTSTGFDVLAVDGRDDIGGLDLDAAAVDLIGAVCAERDSAAWGRLLSPATVEDRRARRLLWDDARAAKERLSRHQAADVTVPLLNIDVHLTRQELEERARPLLEQTVRVTESVMRSAKLAEGRVAGIFLVGGASRIPLAATMLHRTLSLAPVAIEQPELVVAEGSLLAGAQASAGSATGGGDAAGAVALGGIPIAAPRAAAGGPGAVLPAGAIGVAGPGAVPAPSAAPAPGPGAAPAAGAQGAAPAGAAAPVSPGGSGRPTGRAKVYQANPTAPASSQSSPGPAKPSSPGPATASSPGPANVWRSAAARSGSPDKAAPKPVRFRTGSASPVRPSAPPQRHAPPAQRHVPPPQRSAQRHVPASARPPSRPVRSSSQRTPAAPRPEPRKPRLRSRFARFVRRLVFRLILLATIMVALFLLLKYLPPGNPLDLLGQLISGW